MAQKYNISGEVIPHNKRKELNEKILFLIDSGRQSRITKEDIFNAYTGDGGLHGLNRSDFQNYHDYSDAKKDFEQGQFFTPHRLCRFLVDCIKPLETDLAGDMCFGMGNFFNYLPVERNIYGCELDIKAYKVAKYLYPDTNLTCGDIRYYDPKLQLDVIYGNPPYNLYWNLEGKKYLSQYFYMLKAAKLLKPAGFLCMIAPESFLNDDFMDNTMIEQINKEFNYITQFTLPANSFKDIGVEQFNTRVMFFQKKSIHLAEERPYSRDDKENITSISEDESNRIYLTHIKGLQETKEALKAKLFLEALRTQCKDADNFQYRIKKYLYDIRRHPVTKNYFVECQEYVNRFLTQKKPEKMTWDEWEKIKISEKQVIEYLKGVIKKQSAPPERDEIRLVKTSYGLKYKGYSERTRLEAQRMSREISFNEMVIDGEYKFNDRIYARVFRRRLAEYQKQSQEFRLMTPDAFIEQYLENFSLKNYKTGKVIRLNDIQKHDINLILQKNYSHLCWEMGGGKTIAGICWADFHLKYSNIKNPIVLSSANSIYQTWILALPAFRKNYVVIKRLKDIKKIRPGYYILISFEMLYKYQRHIKKYIKINCHNFGLIVDESDETTNPESKRSLSALNVFRKVRYKLEQTGTSTRNTINELYTQIELLYNNSINMLNECEYLYKIDKDDNLREEYNPEYMQPFPAFRGRNLFKECFCPTRVTVFGVKKMTQDVYNTDALERLIAKTIITRTFTEIVGKKMYEYHQITTTQNLYEYEVYRKIVEEFFEMVHYFKNTGNSRKESMLRLVRQLQLLIKCTSIPHLFKEYGNSSQLPGKYIKIFEMLEEFKNEKVAIGTVFRPTAFDYRRRIQELYPERPIFFITGADSFKKRNKIIEDFQATKNGILLSTQQSLKSSVNIPACSKIIIESLLWNMSRLRQYAHRFIRFDMEEFTNIYCVTYENSIEQNLLALLMAKEAINDFVRTLNFKDRSDLYSEYGISLDILEQVMERYRDPDDGNYQIRWGAQKFTTSAGEEYDPVAELSSSMQDYNLFPDYKPGTTPVQKQTTESRPQRKSRQKTKNSYFTDTLFSEEMLESVS